MKKGIDYIGVAAGAMILDNQGRVFLSKRSQNTSNQRGCWETPGGSVNFGETLEEAVRREIREEYGVEIDIIEQWPAENDIIPEENHHWVSTTFLAKLKPGEMPKIMEPNKCDEIGWFKLDKLPEPLSTITKLDLKRYLERPRKP
jgi:mutator protein MutT